MAQPLTLLIFLVLLISQTSSQPTASDSCIEYNTNYSVCTKCLPGLYLQFFFCIPCNPLCACSSNDNYCQYCLNVTYKSRTYMSYRAEKDICILCNETIPFCLQCTNNLTCSKCMMGRYLIDRGCSNQTCTQNCQFCRDPTRCQVCGVGYFLNQTTGLCSAVTCEQNCEICNNQNTCLVCVAGYFVSGGVCQPCVANCAICKDNSTCLGCIPSYIPVNGTCQSTGLSNCIEYTGGVESPTCLVCQPGYYNAQGSCNNCAGCLLCTQSFLCQTQCFQGYNKFNYACIQSEDSIYLWALATVLLLFTAIL